MNEIEILDRLQLLYFFELYNSCCIYLLQRNHRVNIFLCVVYKAGVHEKIDR